MKKFLVYFLASTFLMPVILESINIFKASHGLGAPGLFYNVDNAYFYSYVLSYLKSSSLWPISLGSSLNGYGYYWAPIYLTGWITQLTGIKSYYIYFIIIPVISYVGYTCFTLYEANKANSNIFLGVCILLFYRVYAIAINPKALISSAVLHEKSFFGGNSTLQMNIILSMLIIYAILFFAYKKVSLTNTILSRVFLLLLVFVKMPYVPILILFLGFSQTLGFLLKKKYSFLMVDLITLLLIVVSYIVVIKNEYSTFVLIDEYHKYWHSDNSLRMRFGFNFLSWRLFVPVLAMVLFGLRLSYESKTFTNTWLILLIILGLTIIIDWKNPDKTQLLAPMFLIIPFFTARILMSSPVQLRVRDLIFMAIFCLPTILGSLAYSFKLIQSESNGYEFVNNRELIQILKDLPVASAVIATNDTRYPANNFRRIDKNFQVAGLFGHNCYNCDQVYRFMHWNGSLETRAQEINRRKRVTKILRVDVLQESDLKVLLHVGITHILIHKNFPHSRIKDIHLVKETANYQLYDIQR